MSETATLGDLVARLGELNEDHVICARTPWSATSEAVAIEPRQDGGVPDQVARAGLSYFLEVDVATEVLEVLKQSAPTLDEQIHLLIYYADNDAYRDWVYEE